LRSISTYWCPLVISRLSSIDIEATEGAALLLAGLSILTAMRLGPVEGVLGGTLILLSLVAHELGHLIAAQLRGVRVKAIGLCLKGAYIRRTDSQIAMTELVIASAGPLANLLLFLLLRSKYPVLSWVAELNLILAISNLLPIRGLDGHRILTSLRQLI
jgi:Zn-dependent protease